jgi:hypothetical protein
VGSAGTALARLDPAIELFNNGVSRRQIVVHGGAINPALAFWSFLPEDDDAHNA